MKYSRRTTPLKQTEIQGHHCSVDVRLEKLSKVAFFRELQQEQLDKINEHFRAAHIQKGEPVYHQGEEAKQLFVVVHGAVKLIHHTAEGKDILMDLLKPGEYFGGLPVLGDENYAETAYAQMTSCVLSIGAVDFEQVLHTNPSVAVNLIEITTRRLKQARHRIHQFTTWPVEKRITSVLLMMGEKFGEDRKDGILIQVPFSRKDLADMTGTSSETASRIMRTFQDEGLIRSGRGWVAISDAEKLKQRYISDG